MGTGFCSPFPGKRESKLTFHQDGVLEETHYHLMVWKTLSSGVSLAAGIFSSTVICMPMCTVANISSISLM